MSLTGNPGQYCDDQIPDFFCGWGPEGPHCPSGYACFRINATGEYVCCPEIKLPDGWRRRRKINQNQRENRKTGKICVQPEWPIRPELWGWSDWAYMYTPLDGMRVCRRVIREYGQQIGSLGILKTKKSSISVQKGQRANLLITIRKIPSPWI